MNNYFRLLLSIIIPLLVGFTGSLFTTPAIESGWYDTLVKSSINPPSWVFAPVWTLLYLLMGYSFYLIWNKTSMFFSKGGLIYFLQLVFNFLWSILFFGLRNPVLGLVCIVILLLTIMVNILYFYKIEKKSAFLLIPYLVWVCYATILNFLIVSMNK